jgi:hypothetical protein
MNRNLFLTVLEFEKYKVKVPFGQSAYSRGKQHGVLTWWKMEGQAGRKPPS